MAQSVPAKPRKWRRRLKRAAIALGIVGVLGLLTCTVGWPWVNQGARAYAHHRLGNALDRAVGTLPEIQDYETLLRQDITGTNGWPSVVLGMRMVQDISKKHVPQQVLEDKWRGELSPEEAERERRAEWVYSDYNGVIVNGPGYRLHDDHQPGTFRNLTEDEFRELRAETDPVALTGSDAARSGSIVPVDPVRRDPTREVRFESYLGTLAMRVELLRFVGENEQSEAELRNLILLLSKLSMRSSKDHASWWRRVRNDLMEHTVLVQAKEHGLSQETWAVLNASRWHSPGNDPKLWLNNAAAVYAYLREAHAVSPNIEFYSVKGEPVKDKSFPQFDLNYLPGHEQLMDVVVRNALDARAGVLDLRNPKWVESYSFEFSSEWHPINGVVGCGRETMGWIVREIEREDKLWAEVEALAPTR